MQLTPTLRRIGNDIVAAYLVVLPEGITVIDAGLAGHYRELVDELHRIGRSLADIRGIVLTHGDSDHVGFAERLRRELGVPVYVHGADAARAMGGPKPKTGREEMRLGATLRFFWYAARRGGTRTTWLTEVVEVNDGDRLDLPGAPEIIAVPGHSPGSVAVHVAACDAVFVGDAFTTRHVLTGRTGPQPAPFTDNPSEARASFARIAATKAQWVLPGHGAPWSAGVESAIARYEAAAPPSA